MTLPAGTRTGILHRLCWHETFMHKSLCLLVLSSMLSLHLAHSAAAAESPTSRPSPRLLVHLLDYLARDYPGAVGPGGQVLSPGEYSEQVEFSHTAVETSRQLPELQASPELLSGVEQLAALIGNKAEPKDVATLAHTLQDQVIKLVHLQIGPVTQPDLPRGKLLYQQNCAVCHGAEGRGDGPGATGLTPPPANFLDSARMDNVTPLHAFNTVRIGIPGTPMPSFPSLSDADAWHVSYYVLSLLPGRQLPPWQANTPPVATISDSGTDAQAALAHAKALLSSAVAAYRDGDFGAAKTQALQAYLEGIEPVEPRIKASNPDASMTAEAKMSAVRAAIEAKAPLAQVEAAVAAAYEQIAVLEALLTHNDLSPGVAFVAAASILLREGFEAVLLIMALLGVIRASGSKRAALWVHGGWLAALGLGFITWVFSGYLLKISGAQREMMEAVTSLLAVVVLLIVGFWLHSRTEIGRWNRFLRVKVRAAVQNRSFLGLASIAFLAVFREAFETVLFLRTIWLDSGEQARSALTLGVFVTLALIILASWALLRFSARIPVRKLFAFSAVVMALLAVILTGKGLHALQETGALSVTTSLAALRFETLGLFPTYETLVPQVLVLALIIGLWSFGRRPSRGTSM